MSNVHFILRRNPSTRALAPYFSRRIRCASPLTSATCHKSVRSCRDLRLDHPLMASFFSAQLGFFPDLFFDLFFSQISSGCGGELSRVEVLGCESDVSKFTVGETLPSVSPTTFPAISLDLLFPRITLDALIVIRSGLNASPESNISYNSL